MKRFTFTLLSLLALLSTAHAQATDTAAYTDTAIYADDYQAEDEYTDYEQHNMFRPLDSLKGQMGFFALTTPFMQQQSYGGGLDLQAWYTDNLSIGISLSASGRKVTPTFGYAIGQSQLTYYDISLFNEFKVQQWNRLEAGLRLYTGFSAFHLADKSIMVPYTWYDEYGIAYEGEKPLPIDNNYFLRVAPAFVLRYRVHSHVLIEGSMAYNFFIGNARFGSSKDFSNYVVQLGVKIDMQ